MDSQGCGVSFRFVFVSSVVRRALGQHEDTSKHQNALVHPQTTRPTQKCQRWTVLFRHGLPVFSLI